MLFFCDLSLDFLIKIIDLRILINILLGNETDVLGVNFLNQDIWFMHYIGCFIGILVAGYISIRRKEMM